VKTPLRALAALLLIACAACGSTSPSRFFALAALEPGSESARGSAVVQLDPVQVAEYLDRPQLVRRAGAVELEVDEFHRWAEPLDLALTRVLDADLRQLLGSDAAGSEAPLLRLTCRVSRFERDAEGRAVLEAHWTLAPISFEGAGRRGVWLQQAPLERPGDPAELATSLDGLVHELARALAAEVVR
jgi:uncharacterized lipoprotein YmbA